MLTDGGAAAALVSASFAAVLAHGGSSADLASVSSAFVLTDGGAAAALAFSSSAAVLADRGAATALALASFAVVLTDARAHEFSAEVLSAVVRALLADRGHYSLGSSSCVTKVSADDHSLDASCTRRLPRLQLETRMRRGA